MARRLDTATRARRLLALLPHLHKGDRIPLAALASAVGCTPAEVATDLATLTMCGIPPFTPFDMVDLDIDGDTVTVYMDPPGLDQPLRLTIAEARALGSALEIAGYSSDSPLRVRLNEISSMDAAPDELERTVRTGAAPGGAADVYATIAAAAEDHEKLHIAYYTGSTGRVSERVIHPWAIVQRTGVWYVVGLCEAVGQERVFRMDRIRAIEHTGETFSPPRDIPLSVTPDTRSLRTAEVRFAAGAALPDTRAWPGVTLEPQPDGTTLARVPYQSISWIARRVTAYLGAAEVVDPADVRAAVRALAESLLHSVK